MSEVGEGYKKLFQNIHDQGDRFDNPVAENGAYYAFLSKADRVGDSSSGTGVWEVLFELVPRAWGLNALTSATMTFAGSPPPGPATFFHLRDLDEDDLLSTLGLEGTSELAEGSWYLLSLAKGATGPLVGDLYDWDFQGPIPGGE